MTIRMTEEHARAFFLLAGFTVSAVFETPNRYYPDNGFYDDARKNSPWWLVNTEYGTIRIGWRKRVISVDWDSTGLHMSHTMIEDDVTKDETCFHAWSAAKCVEYLTTLRLGMEKARVEKATAGD